MKSEIEPVILPWLMDENARQKHPTLTALLDKLAVKIVEEDKTLYAWGWRRSPEYSPQHIVTIWAEEVHVDQQRGWESAISLDPSGNPKYNDEQRQRESDRIALLRELADSGRNCKVIMMINRHSREANVAGEAELRVLDDVHWHVEIRQNCRTGKLRRGEKLAAKADRDPDVDEKEPSAGDDPGLRFPDQETRDLVELAAIEHAKQVYARDGFVKSVERENLGYDLDVLDELSGELKLKVEVKGTAGEEEHFYLTRNENSAAKADPEHWRLAVVVDALRDPALQEYTFEEMEKRFARTALAWHFEPRKK